MIQFISNLVDLISKTHKKDWIHVGQCLHDINENLFDCWIRYTSNKDKTKYENEWKSFVYKGYNLKYLCKLVKRAHQEKYKETKRLYVLDKSKPRKFIASNNTPEFKKKLNHVLKNVFKYNGPIDDFGFHNYQEQMCFNRVLKYFAKELYTYNTFIANREYTVTNYIENIQVINDRYMVKILKQKATNFVLQKNNLPVDAGIQLLLENLRFTNLNEESIETEDYNLYLLNLISRDQNDIALYGIGKIIYTLKYDLNIFTNWSQQPEKAKIYWTIYEHSSINFNYNDDILLLIASLYKNINTLRLKKKQGCIYIIIPVGFGRVKVGYSTGTLADIRMRYITAYGNDMTILRYKTNHPELLEKLFQKDFIKENICNELFDIQYLDKYKEYLEEYKDKSNIELQELLFKKQIVKIDEIDLSYENLSKALQKNEYNITDLEKRVKKYKASVVEQQIYKVYKFTNVYYKDTIEFTRWNELYQIYDSKNSNYLLNLHSEYITPDSDNKKLEYMLRFHKQLGLKHSLDFDKTFNKEDLLAFYEVFKDELPDIKILFDVKSIMKLEDENKAKLIANYLNFIFTDWIGINFKVDKVVQKRVQLAKSRFYIYTYSLTRPDKPENIYEEAISNKLLEQYLNLLNNNSTQT